MAWLVLTHVMAGGLALLGALLAGRTGKAARRRNAVRWAFDNARGEAERAREGETAARAELARALQREATAREDAEASKALAATLEAEVVAARFERDEVLAARVTKDAATAVRPEQDDALDVHVEEEGLAPSPAAPPQDALDEKARGIAALHAALVDAVRRATLDEGGRPPQGAGAGAAPRRAGDGALRRIEDLTRQLADAHALAEATRASEAESKLRIARERDDLLAVIGERDRCVERLQRELRRKGERIEDLAEEVAALRSRGLGKLLALLGVRQPPREAAGEVVLEPGRAAAG